MSDAADVAALSDELGYPVSPDDMERRIQAVSALNRHVVFVACLPNQNRVVAWIDVSIVHHLQDRPCGEIGGLVVASDHRSSGIGQQLVQRAEKWVRLEMGVTRMVVRSQISREAAHRFYLREGYTRWKTSAVFSKELDAEE